MNFKNERQRKAVFAQLRGDFDMDGVPMAFDVNPLGNHAMGTGLQAFRIPRMGRDMDRDTVSDRIDVNPHGNYARQMQQEFGGDIVPVRERRRLSERASHMGEGLARGVSGLWPGGNYRAPPMQRRSIAERMSHSGEGMARGIANLWPGGRIGPGEPLEYKASRMGDGLARGMASLWP